MQARKFLCPEAPGQCRMEAFCRSEVYHQEQSKWKRGKCTNVEVAEALANLSSINAGCIGSKALPDCIEDWPQRLGPCPFHKVPGVLAPHGPQIAPQSCLCWLST